MFLQIQSFAGKASISDFICQFQRLSSQLVGVILSDVTVVRHWGRWKRRIKRFVGKYILRLGLFVGWFGRDLRRLLHVVASRLSSRRTVCLRWGRRKWNFGRPIKPRSLWRRLFVSRFCCRLRRLLYLIGVFPQSSTANGVKTTSAIRLQGRGPNMGETYYSSSTSRSTRSRRASLCSCGAFMYPLEALILSLLRVMALARLSRLLRRSAPGSLSTLPRRRLDRSAFRGLPGGRPRPLLREEPMKQPR